MNVKVFKQGGQTLVLFALLIPLLFLFSSVGLDLGWYYVNVSRLQNAADAAVVAGATALVDDLNARKAAEKSLVYYEYDGSIIDTYPATQNATNKSTGDITAADYAKKNLSDSDVDWTENAAGEYILKDNWSRETSSEVTFTPSLHSDDEGNLYYVVHLKEKVDHMIMPGEFESMDAPVVAVAVLKKLEREAPEGSVKIKFDANGGNFGDGETQDTIKFESPEDDGVSAPLTPGKGLPTKEKAEDGTTYEFKGWTTTPNPKSGDKLKDFYDDGKQLTKNDYDELFNKKNSYGEVVLYAIWEEVEPPNNRTLWEQMQYLIAKNVYNVYWYAAKAKHNTFYGTSGKEPFNNSFVNPKVYTDGAGNRLYYTEKIDLAEKENQSRQIKDATQYYIDFFQTTDSRLSVPSSDKNNNYTATGIHEYTRLNSDKSFYGNLRRVHSLFNVNIAYPTRAEHKGHDDPLYCRIEAEPYVSEPTPVRQIVININVDNTAEDLRPLFFFYDGPDARTVKSDNGNGQPILTPEYAQPVILNLNADFKGVLFMPDVPVVINGNGHVFEGFIIAKEYRYLDTTQGVQVEYSSTGKTDKTYTDNRIHVDPETGNVYSIKAEGSDTIQLYTNNAKNVSRFNLSEKSHFKTFHVEDEVVYMYIYYDYSDNPKMDTSPFYNELGDLVPMYKLENGEQVRITKWEDVKLYDSDKSTRKEIPQEIKTNQNQMKGSVRLTNGKPSPVFDAAGNPIYFCADYVKLSNTYTVFTLDRVADNTRDVNREFLLMKNDSLEEPNVSDTYKWK